MGVSDRALNKGIPEAKGDWIYIVDSDDVLPLDALERIAPRTNIAKADPAIGGIMGYRQTKTGEIIGKAFPEGLRRRDAATLTFEDKIRGRQGRSFQGERFEEIPFSGNTGGKVHNRVCCMVQNRASGIRSVADAGSDIYLRLP
jgi:Glycosyl transferase family 2.